VVAAKSVDALMIALDRLTGSTDESRTMGIAARMTVTEGYGWQDYADRALTAYRALLS
jgi:hypothetical protein